MFMHDIVKSILPYYYFIRLKERALDFFCIFLFHKWKIWWMQSSFWRTTYRGAQLMVVVIPAKTIQAKPFFLLPKNECTRKVLIAAIGGSLPKNVYLCFNIILNKLVSKKAGHCKHNFLDITSLFRYISKIFISVVKQLCYVITFL